MATIVQHRGNGKQYVLLGTGFGTYHSSTEHWFLGSMSPQEKTAQFPMACVCDTTGTLHWMPSTDVQVVSVDGRPLSAVWHD